MKTFIFTALLALPWAAHATVYTVSSGLSTSAIQGTINATSTGDTIAFAAGTYNLTAPLTLNCGVTYTGPVASPTTAILNGSASGVTQGNGLFTLWSNRDLSNPCTQPTVIEYLNFSSVATGIFVQTSFTNLTIAHNQFTNIPGRTSQTAAIVFESGTTSSNTASMLTNTTITQNQLGDSNSCVSPTNVMTDTHSPEDYEGACNGMVFFTSINGLTITYNNFIHVAEGVHINCPDYAHQQYPCEPPGGAITDNITAEYNDFSNVHRITWEEQPQQSRGIVFSYNSEHDWFMPYFGSFGLSMACCYNGTNLPNLNASDNLVIFNTNAGSSGRYGYGMEAMGYNSTYNNTLLQAVNSPSDGPGLAYGCGDAASMSNNTVQGGFSPYIENEGPSFPCGTSVTPTQFTGNVTGPNVTTFPSAAPSISPASGAHSYPLIVTLSDPGFMAGSLPLGNTGIWYTTDGSTPVPGSGSARYLVNGGSFVLPAAATVKAVGMWGAANQPTTYPPGFGFVPSPVMSATFSGGAGPSLISAYLVSKGGSTTLPLGRTLQFIAHGVYSDGTSAVLPDSQGDVVTAWNTSNHAIAKISSLGHVTALGLGTVMIEGFIGNLKASTVALTVTPPIASSLEAAVIQPASAALLESPGSVTGTPIAPIADKFLGPLWKVVTPGGGSASISNGHLLLSVPGGSNHDTLVPSNQAVRVVQQIGNTDFDVSIKIGSTIQASNADTSQGLMVVSDDDAFITFALTTDGTNTGLIARIVNAGGSTTVLEDTNFNQYQNPMYLRLARSGDAYMASYSIDGAHWTQATSFTDTGTYTSIGPFASNYNDSPEKAVPLVMSVDWFNTN